MLSMRRWEEKNLPVKKHNQVLRYIDKIRVYSWNEILRDGTMFVGIKENGKKRRYIYFKGKRYSYPTVLWNANHPEDLVKPGEVVHHLDLNGLNDVLSNYGKLTRARHKQLHSNIEMVQKYGPDWRNKIRRR